MFRFRLCLLVLFLSSIELLGQTTQVEIMSARSLKPGRTKNHQKLVGNVALKQGGNIMKCDSAEINSVSNDFMAWGDVSISKNQGLKAWGDSLYFNGATSIGRLMGSCRLKDKKSELRTKVIYIDQKKNIYYYTTPAKINMDDAVITSNRGYYYPGMEKVTFKDNVKIVHPDYTILSDTMDYFSTSQKAIFYGPTNIYFKDEKVYCEAGYYDDKKKIAEFRKNAKVYKKDNTLLADVIWVDKEKEISKAQHNVLLVDSVNKINISGHKGYFNRKTNVSHVTDSALFVQFMKDDTLYLHGDTLHAFETKKKQKVFFAYYNVRMYKDDMQATCDSLSYSFADSLIRLFYSPIIWNGSSQLTGDAVTLLTYDNELKRLYVNKNSFVTSLTDSAYFFYDQIKGKNMIGYFKEGKMEVMDVMGNGQTLYYAKEEKDSTYTGVNRAECSSLRIRFKDSEIEKITFITEPKATFYPLDQFPIEKKILEGFIWHEGKRPKNAKDLYRKN